MLKFLLSVFLAFFFGSIANAQHVYTIDASRVKSDVKSDGLNMGSPGPAGKEIKINNRFMTIGGKPVIPVMGEMHFSRIPRKDWKDVILKMKACGVNIIACYVIWIHHEEIEGKFDWYDNKDLRAFIKLCKTYDMLVYPRIGPWSHAEVRNGGTPDWLLAKRNIRERSTDTVYLKYADEWYRQVASQLKGLLYKDGGPVIGVQLENEYGRGKEGEPYILWLKKTALKYGINVPMYTVTGWDNASVPPHEVIPLWGAYPDEPWATNLERNVDCTNFKFTAFRGDDKIGNEKGSNKKSYIDYSAYPYFTCEMGVGIQNTDHRRLVIGKLDGVDMVQAKLGSGSNLIGYYMFAGGSNPHGLLTSLEENRESGSYNTNPVISYDFQAAIRETGELNGSYFEIKKLHYFLNEFGDRLAPMESVFADTAKDFQYAVRASGDNAFLFGLNYCRHNISALKKKARFSVKLPHETILFPRQAVDIPDSSSFIWPLNFTMNELLLKYATAQPLCQIDEKGITYWVFAQSFNNAPEFCIDDHVVAHITTTNGHIDHADGKYIVSNLNPGPDCMVNITSYTKKDYRILILSQQESNEAWLFGSAAKKTFYLSRSSLTAENDSLILADTSRHIQVESLRPASQMVINGKIIKSVHDGAFSKFSLSVPEEKIEITSRRVNVLGNARWLTTSIAHIDRHNLLNRKFFYKQFAINNPSPIRSADLWLVSDCCPGLLINNLPLNQPILKNELNRIDISGYLKPGKNELLFDFPVDSNKAAFAAKIMINHLNYDQTEVVTDSSWMTSEKYVYPSFPLSPSSFRYAKLMNVQQDRETDLAAHDYEIIIPDYNNSQLKDMILTISYQGDKAALYEDGQLIGDDFYNGSEWRISLGRIGFPMNKKLKLVISPLKPGFKKYFDIQPPIASLEKGIIGNIRLVPEYKVKVNIARE